MIVAVFDAAMILPFCEFAYVLPAFTVKPLAHVVSVDPEDVVVPLKLTTAVPPVVSVPLLVTLPEIMIVEPVPFEVVYVELALVTRLPLMVVEPVYVDWGTDTVPAPVPPISRFPLMRSAPEPAMADAVHKPDELSKVKFPNVLPDIETEGFNAEVPR